MGTRHYFDIFFRPEGEEKDEDENENEDENERVW